jgi:hypothetical protein
MAYERSPFGGILRVGTPFIVSFYSGLRKPTAIRRPNHSVFCFALVSEEDASALFFDEWFERFDRSSFVRMESSSAVHFFGQRPELGFDRIVGFGPIAAAVGVNAPVDDDSRVLLLRWVAGWSRTSL